MKHKKLRKHMELFVPPISLAIIRTWSFNIESSKGIKKTIPVRSGESDLFQAMKQIAETGKGPEEQIPSAGCGIKWKFD